MTEPIDGHQIDGRPTEEQLAERAARADRATRGGLSAVLCLEAMCVLLVPRAIAQTTTGIDAVKTVVLIGAALLLIAVAFCMRSRPWAIGVGSALQLALFATVFWVRAFGLIAVVFACVWLYILNTRRELVRTPGGWRLLVS